MSSHDIGDTYLRRFEATLPKPAHIADISKAFAHMDVLHKEARTAGLSPSDIRVTGTDEHVMVFFTVEHTDPMKICPRKHAVLRSGASGMRGHPDPLDLDDTNLEDG